MTPDDWAWELWTMLDRAREDASERKLRLLACALYRPLCEAWPDETCKAALEAAERCTGGNASGRKRAQKEAARLARYWRRLGVGGVNTLMTAAASVAATLLSPPAVLRRGLRKMSHDMLRAVQQVNQRAADDLFRQQVTLIRDILGDPTRPLLLDPAWLTPEVVSLAVASYEERLPSGHLDPARLLILADALLDAGCDDVQLLQHLRGEGPHWRGCFAVDAVLGKG
jgi:hypothetical protein